MQIIWELIEFINATELPYSKTRINVLKTILEGDGSQQFANINSRGGLFIFKMFSLWWYRLFPAGNVNVVPQKDKMLLGTCKGTIVSYYIECCQAIELVDNQKGR